MDKKADLVFETLNTPQVKIFPSTPSVYRAKTSGGWLMFMSAGVGKTGATFVPDPNHEWDGSSMP